MASNLKETAVKTVIVERKRLQATLSENLEIHKKEFAEAMGGFESARLDLVFKIKEQATLAAEANNSANRKKIHEAYSEFSLLERPVDNSNSYVQAIALMEWETRDKIELSINDFEAYVQDNWTWSKSFKHAHSNYSSPSR